MAFTRPRGAVLARRIAEPRRLILAVAGPRQVGKTTLVQQVTEASGLPTRYASADEPTRRGREWLEQQWEAARLEARDAGKAGTVLVLDEIQKIHPPAGRATVESAREVAIGAPAGGAQETAQGRARTESSGSAACHVRSIASASVI